MLKTVIRSLLSFAILLLCWNYESYSFSRQTGVFRYPAKITAGAKRSKISITDHSAPIFIERNSPEVRKNEKALVEESSESGYELSVGKKYTDKNNYLSVFAVGKFNYFFSKLRFRLPHSGVRSHYSTVLYIILRMIRI
jgi:hypothetical protein